MESIQEFLGRSLQVVDLKTVTILELRQMYLKEYGIAKLSKEEKKLFSTIVESAYVDFVKKESSTSKEDVKDKNIEANNCKSDSESVSSEIANDLSHDSGLGVSHKESIEPVEVKLIENQVTLTDCKETLSAPNSGDISKSDSFHDFQNDNKDSVVNINAEKKKEPVADFSEESEDEPLIGKKDVTENSVPLNFSSDSDNEPLIQSKKIQPNDNICDSSKSLEKESVDLPNSKSNDDVMNYDEKEELVADSSGESEDEPLIANKVITRDSVLSGFSSDSDNEPLIQSKIRKSNASICVSKNEPVSKVANLNSSDSEEKLVVSNKNKNLKKNTKLIKTKKKILSDSEEEELLPSKKIKRQKKLPSGNPKNVNKMNKKKILSDSEEEELLPLKKTKQKKSFSRDNKNPKNKVPLKSVNQKPKPLKIIQKSFVESSDSDELPLISVKTNARNSMENSFCGESRKSNQNNSNPKIQIDLDNEIADSPKSRKLLLKFKSKGSDKSDINSSDSDEPLGSFKTKTPVQKSINENINDEVDNNKQSPERNLKKKHSQEGSDISLANHDSDEDVLPALRKTRFSNSLSDSNVSDSDEKPLTSFTKNKFSEKISFSGSNDSDTDEPLASSKNYSSKKIGSTKNKSKVDKEKTFSESNISQMPTNDMDINDSDEEPLSKFAKRNVKIDVKPKSSTKRKKSENSSDDSEAPIVKKSKTKSNNKKATEKSVVFSSDSEDEPLASIAKSNVEKGEDRSIDENEEAPITKPKLKSSSKVNNSKEQKKQTRSEGKLENLKKYVRAAGIRINSYEKLFENCKSMKSKSEKLLHLLEKEGLKGRPTLAKCKKLKKKIETKKEVAELDISNIISSGRPKRTVCSDTTNHIHDEDDDSDVPLAKYSHLKGIIDSEESD